MSTATARAALKPELAAICGGEHVSDNPRELCSVERVTARAVVTPGSAEEVAAIMKFAAAHDLVVVPGGNWTWQATGAVPSQVDIALRTTRLDAVQHYDPGDLTIGVGAGARLADVQAKLAEHNQFLPLDPPAADRVTIGGVLATAAQGPLKHGYGGPRDFCIGVNFVTGDGLQAKGGGRVVKNVAGYDMMKLLIGSYGTLGVIVSASLKVFPRPRQTRTFVAKFLFANGAIQYRDRVLRSPLTPLCLELLSPRASEYVGGQPETTWNLLLRAAGSEAVLARYRAELGNYIKEELEGEAEARAWTGVREFEETLVACHANAMLTQVSVPVSWVAQAVNAAERVAGEHNFLCAQVGRAGVGSLVMAFVALGAPTAMQYANAVSALRAALPPDACAVVAQCPLEAKAHFNVWGTSPTDLQAMRTVKQALDPAGILNSGRFLV